MFIPNITRKFTSIISYRSLLFAGWLLVLQINAVPSSFRQWISRASRSQDPIMWMNPEQIIQYFGYPVETHHVTTPDGYILQLNRIPPVKSKCGRIGGGRIVFFQHGLLGTSVQWLKNGFNITLAFQLADLGYDVWLGNARGNTYSRQHVWLDPAAPGKEEPPYWDFSWDEMGRYDLPTSMNYALKVGGQKKLSFVCISFGCTLFFIAAIEHHNLNHQVESVFALAPSTFMTRVDDPFLREVFRFYNQIVGSAKLVGVRAFADVNFEGPLRANLKQVCRSKKSMAPLCPIFFSRLDIIRNYALSLFPNTDRHFPTGTSFKTMEQFHQNAQTGDSFKAFDYGPEENFRQYGTVEPISYDLGRVTAPVYIFWSPKDTYASPQDVALLASRLGNVKSSTPVLKDGFGHFDFLTGSSLNEMVHFPIISLLPHPCT